MNINIRNLFNKTEEKSLPVPQELFQPQNPNNKQDGETYHHWGLRVCAIANGSIYTLVPYLHNVYNYIHREQVNNEDLQEEQRRNLNCQIEQKRTDIDVLKSQQEACRQKQQDCKTRMDALNREKTDLKNRAYEVNKEAKMKLIIGLAILVPLTFYLFLFYSSTFYSAFFKNFEEGASVLNSMFDAEALNKAWETSFTELCFVLCAPIIFMGLGFSLHFFTMQKSWTKYLKMGAILCITFLFDAILAYMIGKHLFDMEVIIGTKPMDSVYGLREALGDINTWAVIFCGFIVYIIWGIVFDMSMSAYNQLDLNKINQKAIDEKIVALEQEIEHEKQKEQDFNAQIAALNHEIASLLAQISTRVIIDKAAIRLELNNFFAGWVAQMNILGKTETEQHQANQTFEGTLVTLLN